MNRKGYLLIEVIFGLSLFALVAGVVTQGFLVGLKLFREAGGTDPNEAVITTLLINRIKTTTTGTPIKMHFGSEEWQIKVDTAENIKNISPQLYALNIGIAKVVNAQGKSIASPIEKKYHIFRYLF
ncbi:MAG: hypothetical protein LBQ03_01375 [Puniceicoccales bacterium]|jgi:hypothetical protein|nr:hypothetical protein [Puniceicoccales bacterium]